MEINIKDNIYNCDDDSTSNQEIMVMKTIMIYIKIKIM